MLSAAVVLWRLGADDFADESVYLSAPAAEMARAQRVRKERTATVVVAGLLIALAAVTVVRAALTLANEEQPEETWSGVVISSASLAFMFALWYLKRRAAVVLDSATLEMDAACSLACIVLSFALLAGSLVGLFTAVDDAEGEATAAAAVGSLAGAPEPEPELLAGWWADSVAALVIAVWVGREGVVALRYALSDDFAGGFGCGKAGPGIEAGQKRLLEQMNRGGNTVEARP